MKLHLLWLLFVYLGSVGLLLSIVIYLPVWNMHLSDIFCHLPITFANSLYPDQVWQNDRLDLDPNCLGLNIFMIFCCWKISRPIFLWKIIWRAKSLLAWNMLVRASPASLRCGPWARHIYPSCLYQNSNQNPPELLVDFRQNWHGISVFQLELTRRWNSCKNPGGITERFHVDFSDSSWKLSSTWNFFLRIYPPGMFPNSI